MFLNYSTLKSLNHLTENFAGMFLGWSFTKYVFCVERKSTTAGRSFNIGCYGKMKKIQKL